MMGTRIEMSVVRAGDVLKMMRSYFHINLLRNRNKLLISERNILFLGLPKRSN